MNRRGPFIWLQLHPPTPMPVDVARATVAALAAMSGHPRIVLEARGRNGMVTWHLGAEAGIARRALAVVGSHLAGLRTSDSKAPAKASAAGAIRLAGHRAVQLSVGSTDEAARGVLGALAAARKNELVRLQIILGPRHRPRELRDVPAENRAKVKAKYSEHRFSCEVRIGAKAEDTRRAGNLIQGVAASIRVLEAPGLALHLKKSSLSALDDVRDPFLWPLELNVSELTALLGWPLGPKDAVLPGVPSPHPRLLPVVSGVAKQGRVIGYAAVDEERPVALSVDDSLRHLHILGPNGVGKSVLMANLALQDIVSNRATCVIDAKGDTITDILARIPADRHQDVVVLDPTDPAPIGIDVFRGDPERSADVIYRVFKDLYGGELGPRSSDLLHAGLVTLARAGECSLSMLPMLLSNAGFRRSIVGRVASHDPLGLGAFWGWFESISDAERLTVVAPLRNKLDPVLTLRPGLRAMFGQRTPHFALSDVFKPGADRRPILLVSLASASLGPEGSRLLGSILLALLWEAAKERAVVPQEQRHPVAIHVDEMQEVVRLGDLGTALAMARGYGVSFTLSHQSLTQLSASMTDAVMANARNRICFQLSPKDAKAIAVTTNGALTTQDFMELPAFSCYASVLSRSDRMPWCSIRTAPLASALQTPGLLIASSRERYGRPIAEVEADLMAVGGFGSAKEDESFGRSRRQTDGGAA